MGAFVCRQRGTTKRGEKRKASREKLAAWIKLRHRVAERDHWKCRLCGKPVAAFETHHLLSRALGGKDELHNLVTLHKTPCHEDVTGHLVWLRWRDDTNRAGTLRIERV